MTRGRVVPLNSKVRRRLFSDDETPPAKRSTWDGDDYLSCIRKTEYVARNLNDEVILKGMKWNFDFQREKPKEGPISWYRKGSSGEWVGMKPTGRTISMRKRNRDPDNAHKSVYHDERNKVRRLSLSSVAQRRGFFNDGRSLENAIKQAKDDNFTNTFMDQVPVTQLQEVQWNFDFDCDNSAPSEGPVRWEQVGDEWVGHRPGHPLSVVVFKDVRPTLREELEKGVKNKGKGNKMHKAAKTVKVDVAKKVVIENTEATEDSDMVKRLSVISINKINSLENNTDDLLTENANMETQDDEKANDMKKLNETTPRNARSGQEVPRSKKTKATRMLYFRRRR